MKPVQTFFLTAQQRETSSSAFNNSTMNEVRTIRSQTLQSANMLDLAGLQVVKWAQEQQLIMAIFHLVAQVYARLKGLFFIGWFIVITEMIVVWWWTFLHNLNWPQFVLTVISTIDGIVFRILDFLQRRLEWWWDVVSVRLMWFRESIENILDRYLTIADKYFAMLQDLILAIYNIIMTPFRAIFEKVASYDETQGSDEKETLAAAKSTMPLLNKNGSLRRNSGEYQYINEDVGDEDYLSDASMDSRRFMTEDNKGQVYTRYRTTATAEGKFREAMYHRVSNELGLMRKNSIRFSRGLVNCARQMVGVRTQEYAESFLGFFQKWARELGLLEILTTMEEEMRGRRFLAKPLVLVRVLSEALLASLLRLVKGKKSRRTRSMRSESLRRRAQQSLSGTNNPLPLSPAALQQSSEPVQHPRLPVPPILRQTVLKEEERDLDGFLSKDSALGSEDNHSETCDSDQTISPNDEGLESDSDVERRRWKAYGVAGAQGNFSRGLEKVQEEDFHRTLSSGSGRPASDANISYWNGNMTNPEIIITKATSKKNKSSKQKLRFNQ